MDLEESPELQILEERTDNSFEKICALIDENEKLTEKNLKLEHDIQKLREVNMKQVKKFEDQIESLLQDNETLEAHIKSLNRRLLKEEIEKEGLTEINEEKRELISEYKIMNLKNLGSINVSKKQDNQSEDTRNLGRENETVNTWTLVEKEKSLRELSDECNQIVFNVMKDINLQFNPPHKLRKRRAMINAATRFALEEVFKQNPRPSAEELAVLCDSLDMEREVVRVWFQNRRQMERKHGLEEAKDPDGVSAETNVAPHHLEYRKGEELFPPDHRFIHHGRRQSQVWQYGGFKKDEDGKLDKSRVFCSLCGKDFRYFRSPDKLLRHLRNTHPNEFNEKSQEENEQSEETGLEESKDTGASEDAAMFTISAEPKFAPRQSEYRIGEELFPPEGLRKSPNYVPSHVWQYGGFRKDEDGNLDKSKIFCGICGKGFNYFRSHNDLRGHLRYNHPNEYTDEKNTHPNDHNDDDEDNGDVKKKRQNNHSDIDNLLFRTWKGDMELFPPPGPPHGSPQPSRAWKFGGLKKDEDGNLIKSKIFCGLCGHEFVYKASANPLLRHLRNTHPNEFNEKTQEENKTSEETEEIEMDTAASQGQEDEQSEEIETDIEMETATSHEQDNDVGEEIDHNEAPEMIEDEHTDAEKFLEESSSDEDELSTDEKSDGKQKIASVLNSRRTYCRNCPVCIQEDCNTCANCLDRPKNGGANKLKQKCMIKAQCVYTKQQLKCPLPDCSVEKTYPKLWLLQWHIGSHFCDIFLKHFPRQNNCPLCPRKIHSVTEHVYHLGVSHKTLLDVIPEDDLRKEYILPFFKKYI